MEERTSVRKGVDQAEIGRGAVDEAPPPLEVRRENVPGARGVAFREPELAARRPPGQAPGVARRLREDPHDLALAISDHDPVGGGVRKGGVEAVPGDTQIAATRDRSGNPLEDRSGGLLDRDVAVRLHAGDAEVPSVGRPVGKDHVLQQLARGAADHGDHCERTDPEEALLSRRVEQDGHMALRRDRQHLGVDEAEGPRLGAIGAGLEELDRLAVPASAVDDGAAVRREARLIQPAPPEGQLLEDGGRLLGCETAAEEPEAHERGGHEQCRARLQPAPRRCRRHHGPGRLARRAARERVERKRHVAGRLEPVVRVLLETPPHEPVESRRHRPAGHCHRRWVVLDDRRQRVRLRRPLERSLPRQHLEEHRPQRKHVRARRRGKTAELLQGHVAGCAHPDPLVGDGPKRVPASRRMVWVPGRMPEPHP